MPLKNGKTINPINIPYLADVISIYLFHEIFHLKGIILLKYSLNAPAGHNLPQKIGPKMNDIKKSITA